MTDDHSAVREAPGPPMTAAARLEARFRSLTDQSLNRVGLRGATARDTALAVVVAVASAGFLWLLLASLVYLVPARLPLGTELALTAAMVAQSLTLSVRRRYPTGCLMAATALQVLMVALFPREIGVQGPALMIAAYTCGTRLAPLRLVTVIVAAVLLHGVGGGLVMGTLAPAVDLPLPQESSLLSWSSLLISGVPLFVAPALFGAYVATRRRFAELVRARAAEEVRAQRERLEGALRDERTRMARELHDIAAHHLSGMVVQAGAAERLVGRDDQAAREAMNWVRTQGRETLDSLRLVVGALREPGEEAEGLRHRGEPGARGAPVPGLAALDRLVAAERELGTGIDLSREGEPYALPPITDITAYRVVQESLSNARDHARGARVRLSLRYEPARAVLEIENGPGGTRDAEREHRGLGVLGMRERAQVVGARLETGPTGAGGWLVRWEVPVERDRRAGAAVKESPGKENPGKEGPEKEGSGKDSSGKEDPAGRGDDR